MAGFKPELTSVDSAKLTSRSSPRAPRVSKPCKMPGTAEAMLLRTGLGFRGLGFRV